MSYTKEYFMNNELFNTLLEVRAWIGDGEFSDGLPREYWTQEYKDLVDKVDGVLNNNMVNKYADEQRK